MNHQRRVDLYRQYMAESGADPRVAVPPFWEFAWSRGWELAPPPFMSCFGLAFFAALAFPALAFGLWLLFTLHPRYHSHMPFTFAAWIAAGLGLFGVIAFPLYYKRMAKRYGLSRWSTFVGARQRTW